MRKDFSELEGEIQLEVKELNPNNGKDKEQIEIIETEMEKFIPEKVIPLRSIGIIMI